MSGCATNGGFGTFTGKLGGVCDAFPRAEYQVLGKTSYDQAWIDDTTEAEVAGCKFARPIVRPPTLDAVPAADAAPVIVKPAKKKLSIWSRTKAKLHLRKRIEP